MNTGLRTIRELITFLENLAKEHGDDLPAFTLDNDKPTQVMADLAVLVVFNSPGAPRVSMRDLGGTPTSLFPEVTRALNEESVYKHVLAVRVY